MYFSYSNNGDEVLSMWNDCDTRNKVNDHKSHYQLLPIAVLSADSMFEEGTRFCLHFIAQFTRLIYGVVCCYTNSNITYGHTCILSVNEHDSI